MLQAVYHPGKQLTFETDELVATDSYERGIGLHEPDKNIQL